MLNIEAKQKLSALDKLALWITKNVGTMGFFFIIFIWTVVWLGWNWLAPKRSTFGYISRFCAMALSLKRVTNIPYAPDHDRAEPTK